MLRPSLPRILLVGALAAAAATTLPPSNASAQRGPRRAPGVLESFVVAHPDDWQLFMGDVAMAASRAGAPSVFIIVTAGDAGRPAPYWLARERGAIASMLVTQGTIPADPDQRRGDVVPPATCEPVLVEGQSVRRCAHGRSATYFLRLPDGNLDGSGFAATGRAGLARFEAGRTPSLVSRDSVFRVASWATLGAAITDLLRREAARARVPATHIRLHAADPDSLRNPRDHSDHRAVGRLVEGLAAEHAWALTQYVEYDLAQRPVNTTPLSFGDKAAVFMAYDRARILADSSWSAYTEAPHLYSAWLTRSYGRVVRPLPGPPRR